MKMSFFKFDDGMTKGYVSQTDAVLGWSAEGIEVKLPQEEDYQYRQAGFGYDNIIYDNGDDTIYEFRTEDVDETFIGTYKEFIENSFDYNNVGIYSLGNGYLSNPYFLGAYIDEFDNVEVIGKTDKYFNFGVAVGGKIKLKINNNLIDCVWSNDNYQESITFYYEE